MKRNRLLFGLKSVPYPLRADGVSVRYLPIIEYLAKRHEVDLIIISGKTNDLSNIDKLRRHCRKITLIRDPRRDSHRLSARCRTYARFLFPWTPPMSMVCHDGSGMTRSIVEAAPRDGYDAVVWAGGYLLPNLMAALPHIMAGKIVVDFIDSPYLWATRAKDPAFRFGPLDRYERWKTRRWEGGVIRKADATVYISRIDAEAVPSDLAPAERRHVVPNGVNIPDSSCAERADLPSPNIGFLGNMWYQPNVEAVEWLYNEVFAPLRRIHPDLTLVVIGRDPAPPVRELGRRPGVIVTGTVDDIWAYVRSIDLFLFPLLRGAGLKNKILEAMYAGRPVLTTEIGNEGLDASSGRDLVICSTAGEFQREAMRLLGSSEERSRMGASARAYVQEKFFWDRILRNFEDLVCEGLSEDEAGAEDGEHFPTDPAKRG